MKHFLLALLLILTLAVPSLALELLPELADASGTDGVAHAVPDSARSVTKGISPAELPDINASVNNILNEASKQTGSLLRESLKSIMLILGIIMLCGAANILLDEKEKDVKIIPLAAILGVAAVIGGQTHTLLGTGRDAIAEMDAFSKILLPSLAIASAAAGAPTAAFTRQMATMLFSGILINAVDKLLIPMVYAYYAIITCNALTGRDMLVKLAKLVKWMVTGILTTLIAAFVLYLTVSSVISGSSDVIAMKSAKMLMSGVVPVVGGIIGDAAETVLAGAAIIKNAIGIFGLTVILGICLVPFLRLGIQMLMFKLAAALSSPLADKQLAQYLDEVGGVFSLILALTASSAFLLMISLVSGIMAGGGL